MICKLSDHDGEVHLHELVLVIDSYDIEATHADDKSIGWRYTETMHIKEVCLARS